MTLFEGNDAARIVLEQFQEAAVAHGVTLGRRLAWEEFFEAIASIVPDDIKIKYMRMSPLNPSLPLDARIEELDLGVRSYNVLRRAGFVTVEDVVKASRKDLTEVPNLGERSIDEVVEVLDGFGYELAKEAAE